MRQNNLDIVIQARTGSTRFSGKPMKILIVIPARSGSKGIPRKNIRFMNGRPLISYAIKTAKNSSYLPDVYVSTNNTEIADISVMYGAKIIERS